MPTIVCDVCNKVDEIKFLPEEGAQVMCKVCFKTVREERERSIPRKAHGTRVSFPIKCAECGKLETLDYIPKGHMQDPLCTECAGAHFNDRMAFRATNKSKERDAKTSWDATCMDCGRVELISSQPAPDFLCSRCYNDHEQAAPNILKGTTQVAQGIHVRKSRKKK
jgi:hypothetical protein